MIKENVDKENVYVYNVNLIEIYIVNIPKSENGIK